MIPVIGDDSFVAFLRLIEPFGQSNSPVLRDSPRIFDQGMRGIADKPAEGCSRQDAKDAKNDVSRGASKDVILVEMPEGIEELIPAFLTTQKEGAATLLEMLSASEFDGIRRFAHNLKGTGTAFGFPRLSEIGVRMERSAREANLSDLTSQIRILIDYLDRVRVRRKGE